MLAELKQCFLEAYDDNNDGKIDIREVKTKNTFAFCLGYICTCCKKTLSAFGYSSYYIYTSKKSKGKKAAHTTLLQNPKQPFSQLGIFAKSFFMHFLLFSLFLCILAAILAILLVNVFLVSLKKMSLRGEGKSYLQVCLSNIWLGCN